MNDSDELAGKNNMVESIIDYISGLEIIATPEEVEATQPFSKILVEDYRYPKEFIQTRPQFKVKSRPSDNIKEYPVDIAVFDSENHTDSNISIVVECKKKNRKDGKTQLESYLTLSNAKCGVWFNGEEKLFIRKIIKNGGIKFVEIPNIPRFGERLEDVGRFRRRDLQDTHNLKSIFKTIRNYLAANAIGATTDDVLAQQLINIIFCKIYDERFTPLDDLVSFRAGLDEDISKIKERILQIFTNVKIKYKEVITNEDNITLDDKSIAYIVGELQNYCLIDVERDVIADAFEVFIGHALKGDKGQFFTPRNVIKLMIEIIQPTENDIIIDSACGSGGFLIEALRYVWKKIKDDRERIGGWSESAIIEEQKEFAMNKIHGLEKDKFLVKLTKAYMAILGDGKGGVFCEDSLDLPKNWQIQTQNEIKLDSFDILLANPPFGKNIKIEGKDKLSQFTLAKKIDKKGKQSLVKTGNVSSLFLERNIQFLRKGGKMGIILPEPYFALKSYQNCMEFMFNGNNIMWIIDLPHNTFRPHNNAKCCAIIIEKGKPQQEYINMAVAEYIGHDHQGKPIYNNDNSIKDDTRQIIQEIIERQKNNGELKTKYDRPLTFKVLAKDVKQKNILVPRFYWKTKLDLIKKEAEKKNIKFVSIQTLIDEKIIESFSGHGSPKGELKGEGDIPYIRVKDIVNWQTYIDVTSLIPRNEYERIFTNKKKLKAKDILYVSRGSYRIGSVAMVSPYDGEMLLTKEINVIRVKKENNHYGITPEYLLYALSHRYTWEQTENKVFYEPCLPNIADRWKEILLPIPNNKSDFDNIKLKMKDVIEKQWKSKENISDLKQNFDVFIV